MIINVLRRILPPSRSVEEGQRENLVHITYRVRPYTNVVTASLVDKLKLVTTP